MVNLFSEGILKENGVNLLLSLILFLIVLAFRALAKKSIQSWNIRSLNQRRRWLSQARLAGFAILAIGLIVIWASEIRTLALSVAALAVAIVIGLKELLACVLGSFVKTSNQSFRIGDRIVVGEHRGDVIEATLLATTLLEVGPGSHGQSFTGRSIVLPNSIFLTTPILNESLGQHHCLHLFSVNLEAEKFDWPQAKEALEELARREARRYLRRTQRLMDRYAQSKTIESQSVEAQVLYDLSQAKEVKFWVRIPCRHRDRAEVEQRILSDFAEQFGRLQKN